MRCKKTSSVKLPPSFLWTSVTWDRHSWKSVWVETWDMSRKMGSVGKISLISMQVSAWMIKWNSRLPSREKHYLACIKAFFHLEDLQSCTLWSFQSWWSPNADKVIPKKENKKRFKCYRVGLQCLPLEKAHHSAAALCSACYMPDPVSLFFCLMESFLFFCSSLSLPVCPSLVLTCLFPFSSVCQFAPSHKLFSTS